MKWIIILTLFYALPDGTRDQATAYYEERYASRQVCEAVMDEKVEKLLQDLRSGKIKLPEEAAKAGGGTYQAQCTLSTEKDV